jgi:hypothetical protein
LLYEIVPPLVIEDKVGQVMAEQVGAALLQVPETEEPPQVVVAEPDAIAKPEAQV